jgi:hypothetical protein
MFIDHPKLTLLLIPLALGLAFMLGVIWALEKQIRCERRYPDKIARAKAFSNHPEAFISGAPEQHGTRTQSQHNSAEQPPRQPSSASTGNLVSRLVTE